MGIMISKIMLSLKRVLQNVNALSEEQTPLFVCLTKVCSEKCANSNVCAFIFWYLEMGLEFWGILDWHTDFGFSLLVYYPLMVVWVAR